MQFIMEFVPGPARSGDIENEVVLPVDNWQTKIIEKKIIKGDNNSSNVQVHFFVKITNKEDFKKWLVEFENLTGSSYVIRSTDSEDGRKVKLKQRLVCHHFTRSKGTYTPPLKKFTRNTNCPSRLAVTIHAIHKKYLGKKENYDLIRQMPCEIILIATHNHSTGTVDSLRFRRVSDSVRDELINLYQNGHSPVTALEMIKCQIQLGNDNYGTALADRNQCPSYKYCYYLYKSKFKQQYGPQEFNVTTKILLQNKLKLYNDKHADTCAKMLIIGQEHADYVIGICTPIMKRVHKYNENASNIVFMDSSCTVDRDGSRIFVLLTDSECGALPLGLIITNSESVDAIKCGLQILIDILGKNIFWGHKEGPKVFMTDDSLTEQKALRETWPQVKCLLSIFHVLQAQWRWMSQSKNGIPKEQRTKLYIDFRNILYSKNIEEMLKNYRLAMDNAIMYRNYINYFNNYWWPKRESWVKAYRNGCLLNNNYTKNCPEAMIRQIKEQIFSRIKAFNVVQMVDFMITKFEDYNEKKLLDASSNRLSENPLFKPIQLPASEILQRIVKLDENIIAVPSENNQNLMFIVNMEILMCSCIQEIPGSICKHIDWANILYCNDNSTVTIIDDYQIRQKLRFIATGQTPTDNDDVEEYSSEINISETTRENEYDEIKEKFKESMEKVSLIFRKNFEKSPLKVITSMKNMVGTLEKLDTPAAFSSAVATLGCRIGRKRKGRAVQAVTRRKITKIESRRVAENGQYYTRSVSNLQDLQQDTVGSLGGLGNIIQLPDGQPTIQNIPGLGNVQVISQQQPHLSGSQHQYLVQQDPDDPTKWQIIPQIIITAAPQANQREKDQDDNKLCEVEDDPESYQKSERKPQPVWITDSKKDIKNTITPLNNSQVSRPISVSTIESSPASSLSSNKKQGKRKQRVRIRVGHSNGKMQYICHIPGCNKFYEQPSHLRAHLTCHTGQRPFVCTWLHCEKRFTRSDELQRHRRIHTRTKRFQCAICDKNFMRSDYLLKHVKTHQELTADEDQDDHEVSEVEYDLEPQKESEQKPHTVWTTDTENEIKYVVTHLDHLQVNTNIFRCKKWHIISERNVRIYRRCWFGARGQRPRPSKTSKEAETSIQEFASSHNSSTEERIIIIVDPLDS